MSPAPVPLADARAWVLGRVGVLPVRTVLLDDAGGGVLAEDVIAAEAVPAFANTAMDGYAVRASDTTGAPVELAVIATLAAGTASDAAVGPGQAVRIMTGAPLPRGADAVVMVERTETLDDGTVRVNVAARPGEHVRRAGEDVQAGQRVFQAGVILSPAHLGVLASIGVSSVAVVSRARVGVLSTGDELVEGGGSLGPGQIRDSNRHALLALVTASGGQAIDLGIVGDDPDRVTAALMDGIGRSDALLTSGGVSMGDFDYVKVVLDRLSAGSMRWMQVAIRPAKPFAFGLVDGVPVFGLPGNPVSSMVSFECFARPALRQMMGHTVLDRPTVRAVADEALRRRDDDRLDLLRVSACWSNADARWHVRSTGGQGSHQLLPMASANALALVAEGGGVEAGEEVNVWLLDLDGLTR